MSRAMEVSQADSVNTQYATNRQYATSNFAMLEGILGDVTNMLQNAQQLVVSAGNGTLNDSGRIDIATELRGNLGELLGLANRTDGNGQYLFSGFQGSTKPFADTGSGIQYFGDEGLRMIQVSASRQLAVNESGRRSIRTYSGVRRRQSKYVQDTLQSDRLPGNPGGYSSRQNRARQRSWCGPNRSRQCAG